MKRQFFFILIVVILGGCDAQYSITPTLPSIESTLISSPMNPTFESSIATPEQQLKTQCLDVLDKPIEEAFSNSVLVLTNEGFYQSGEVFDTYLINMNSMQKKYIKLSKAHDFAVSPDAKLIAFSEFIPDENGKDIVIATSGFQILERIHEEEYWSIEKWIDMQHLLMVGASTTLVINPFTGERESLTQDLPDIYAIDPTLLWAKTSYNSSLDRVVYPKYSPDLNYVLWDIQQQMEIARFQFISDPLSAPRWSPDDCSFALAQSLPQQLWPNWPKYEIYNITCDGEVSQITHLSEHYPRIYIADLSWSPDGNYLAFWFSYWLTDDEIDFDTSVEQHLAILDIRNNQVINYCIAGTSAQPGIIRLHPQPLWSPDSNQVVVKSHISQDVFSVILIDISSGQAFHLEGNLEPVGWMVLP